MSSCLTARHVFILNRIYLTTGCSNHTTGCSIHNCATHLGFNTDANPSPADISPFRADRQGPGHARFRPGQTRAQALDAGLRGNAQLRVPSRSRPRPAGGQTGERRWFSTGLGSRSPAAAAGGQKRSCDLLVLGAGTAGCALANKFAGKKKVIVVDPADTHYYQPMFTLVGGGLKKFEETNRPTRDVLSSACDWLQDKAVHFDPANNTVTTQKGDTTPGLVEALDKDPTVCSNYSPRYVHKTWPALQNFKGGNAIFTFPNSPVKCAGAPQKICYLAEEYFTKNGVRDKTKVFYKTSLPGIFGVPRYAKALDAIAASRNINVEKRVHMIEVKPASKEVVFEQIDKPGQKETLKYDLLHAVPNMSSPSELWKCPLVDATNFVSVSKETLQHTTYKNVFALGDCSNIPTSKTAAAIAVQSGVAIRNLQRVMDGKDPDKKYDGYTSCPITINHNQVMMCEFGYDGSALETFFNDQTKPSYAMFLMKAHLMPIIYWRYLLNGNWPGPGTLRKILRPGK